LIQIQLNEKHLKNATGLEKYIVEAFLLSVMLERSPQTNHDRKIGTIDL